MMQHSRVDLKIMGRKCRIHRNISIAAYLDEGANLIEINRGTNDDWGGEQSVPTTTSSALLVDRYDARALLDEFSLRQLSAGINDAGIDTGVDSVSVNRRALPSEEDGSREEMKARNFVRYEGLDEDPSAFMRTQSNDSSKDGGENLTRRESGSGDNRINQIHFPEEENPFQLSEEQSRGVPSGIQLPRTMQQNTIIEHTASRVARTIQLEVFLKVKQANDAAFAFLNPTNELHEYYLYLREKYGRIAEDRKTDLLKEGGDDDGEDVHGVNPLSGLLGGYSSSSEEECEGPSKNDDISNIKDCRSKKDSTDGNERQAENNDGIQSEEQERKRKADRLERLRIWKESRLG